MTPQTQLTTSQIVKVKLNKWAYIYAQSLTGVPWAVIAGVNYRESDLASDHKIVKTVGGIYQFDPIPAISIQQDWLRRFSTLPPAQIENWEASLAVDDFLHSSLLCACKLREGIQPVLNKMSPDAVLKEAFWAYNGRAYGSADNSPYVMNNADVAHMGMRIIGSEPDGRGGRIQINTIDERPGAFVVFDQIRKLGI